MAQDLREQLTRLTVKASMLQERYTDLQQLLRQSEERILELETEARERRREISALRQQMEMLKVATTVAPSPEDIAGTRAILSEILSEIDKCIEQLTF